MALCKRATYKAPKSSLHTVYSSRYMLNAVRLDRCVAAVLAELNDRLQGLKLLIFTSKPLF